jgi:NADPH:quinone reductase-like Zn-dependent oxidoreductase
LTTFKTPVESLLCNFAKSLISMFNIPKQQKAVIFNTETNKISFTSSAPIVIAAEELLIKVHSTAITNGELEWGQFVNWPVEHIPCYDVSGTVLSLPTAPASPHGFKEGDRIFGRIMANREGAAQEYANILPSEAALVPKGLDMDSAACVPMSAHTAWQAIFEKGLLTGSFTPTSVPHVNSTGETILNQAKGERVLVLGAAGSVGQLAVQFAKLAGAFVAGTASTKNEKFLKGLNVDEVVDYTKLSIAEYVSSNEKFDLVFDCVGGQSMLDGWRGVKDNGVYVSVVPGFKEPEGGKPAGIRTEWFIMEPRSGELAAIGEFFAKGMLKTNVDSVWKLEQFQEAFSKTATRHARGKVVLKVSDAE